MINLYRQDGETLYGIKEFILDSPEDLSNLPTNIRSGSSALIIPTGEVYFLNGSKQWTMVGGESTESGGSSSDTILNQLDKNKNDIIDEAEEAHFVIMHDM